MTHFDKQRIENAIWVLEHYSEELQDTGVEIMVDGVYINVLDALKVLDLLEYKLVNQ